MSKRGFPIDKDHDECRWPGPLELAIILIVSLMLWGAIWFVLLAAVGWIHA